MRISDWSSDVCSSDLVAPCGRTASPKSRLSENRPGSQPTEIRAVLPPERAAASTAAQYSGIFACVSKLSTVLNKAANSGPCPGKSFLEPPHKITTSISYLHCASDSTRSDERRVGRARGVQGRYRWGACNSKK